MMHVSDCVTVPAWMRVLTRRGAFLQRTSGGAKAYTPSNRFAEAVAFVDQGKLSAAIEAGWLTEIGDNKLGPSPRGIAALRAARIAATQDEGPRPVPSPDLPMINDAENPLAWLARRRDKAGKPLISQEEFNAGERLRADFWFAQMTPRVTMSWNSTFSLRKDRRSVPGAGLEMQDSIVAARERVQRAMRAVGPELSGILIDVCCHLNGLEDAERSVGWPQRSGKVVLQLALTRLARHYGLLPPDGAQATAPVIRHWGAPDFRPGIE